MLFCFYFLLHHAGSHTRNKFGNSCACNDSPSQSIILYYNSNLLESYHVTVVFLIDIIYFPAVLYLFYTLFLFLNIPYVLHVHQCILIFCHFYTSIYVLWSSNLEQFIHTGRSQSLFRLGENQRHAS